MKNVIVSKEKERKNCIFKNGISVIWSNQTGLCLMLFSNPIHSVTLSLTLSHSQLTHGYTMSWMCVRSRALRAKWIPWSQRLVLLPEPNLNRPKKLQKDGENRRLYCPPRFHRECRHVWLPHPPPPPNSPIPAPPWDSNNISVPSLF